MPPAPIAIMMCCSTGVLLYVLFTVPTSAPCGTCISSSTIYTCANHTHTRARAHTRYITHEEHTRARAHMIICEAEASTLVLHRCDGCQIISIQSFEPDLVSKTNGISWCLKPMEPLLTMQPSRADRETPHEGRHVDAVFFSFARFQLKERIVAMQQQQQSRE